jgi:hypothetical protein
MAEESLAQDPISALLSEFGTRLNEVEEKQRLVKDRILLIGENLINTKEEYDKDIEELRIQINQINEEIKDIKRLNRRIVNELGNFARKTEVKVLDRQMKMFQPLDVARISDVKTIVKEELAKIQKPAEKNKQDKTIKKRKS